MNLAKLARMSAETAATPPEVIFQNAIRPMAFSLALGVLLMAVSIISGRVTAKTCPPAPGENPVHPRELILNAANVMYLCLGVTAVMILVNNDLARAFAIGAAIALVRFRIKMSEGSGGALFFAVIIGMACGVDQSLLGWAMGLIYTILQGLVLLAVKLTPAKPLSMTPAVFQIPADTVDTVRPQG